MKVKKIMNPEVRTCRSIDMLDRAAQLMWDHDIGCLPVVNESGHVVGMVTDRDICMAAYTQGQALRGIAVFSAMAHQVHSCQADDDLAAAEAVMRQHQIRRMPVIDDQGHPIGILTLNDIARAARHGGPVTPVEVSSTLSAVCEPRRIAASA
ncbi:MAG: CBS domain-containing protein [Kofleriaceae bacterium]|nr:CBS domain-containing protein [Kofleriaceae bacterium]MCB9573372.1 CBS domain-containing protein [Kofleriaceae bacterium]